jgi:predicted lipoprotein with Yx(FWY)xxD motif
LTISLAATTALSSALTAGALAPSAVGAPLAHSRPAARSAAHRTAVHTAHSSLGTYLVDGKGRSLYLFLRDKHHSKSHCYGDCARDWPPLLTKGAPRARGKAKPKLLGTTRRRNGDRQVTYNGHPLYRFAGDQRAGQTNGEGITQFGAEWDVVSPKGHKT